jgi:hypothetical protein
VNMLLFPNNNKVIFLHTFLQSTSSTKV